MVTPCMVKSWLYRSGPIRSFSGRASWVRMVSAARPATRKKAKEVTMKRRPMILWFTGMNQPQKPEGRFQLS